MTRRPLIFLAWLAFAGIIFVTVSPIGLRPHDIAPVDFDRAAAFALLALLFVVAYPRHWVLCALLIMLSAFFIELLQFLSPTRHANVHDALVKATGASIGSLIGLGCNAMVETAVRRLHSTAPRM